MTGNVDKAHAEPGLEHQRGEAQIDGEPSLSFLGESIRVDPRQSFDERGLTVVDVARGADDHVEYGLEVLLHSCSGFRPQGSQARNRYHSDPFIP